MQDRIHCPTPLPCQQAQPLESYQMEHLVRPDKSDPIRIIRIKRTEMTSEIIDLKFTRIENDPYWIDLDPNIFC